MPRNPRRHGICLRCHLRRRLVQADDLCGPCWRILRSRRVRTTGPHPDQADEHERRLQRYRELAAQEQPLFDP